MMVATTKHEDQLLVEGLGVGDQKTLEKIYKVFFPPILGFVKNHGGNAEDAKDIFQEGIMVMYRMVQKPDFKLTSSFLSLLFPICRNLWFKSLRKRPYYEDVTESKAAENVLDSDVEAVIHDREVDSLFRKKMNQLGEQCQRLLNLFFEGHSMKEIVGKIGLSSVSFAKKKKFQCKEKLVQLVQSDPLYKELKF